MFDSAAQMSRLYPRVGAKLTTKARWTDSGAGLSADGGIEALLLSVVPHT